LIEPQSTGAEERGIPITLGDVAWHSIKGTFCKAHGVNLPVGTSRPSERVFPFPNPGVDDVTIIFLLINWAYAIELLENVLGSQAVLYIRVFRDVSRSATRQTGELLTIQEWHDTITSAL